MIHIILCRVSFGIIYSTFMLMLILQEDACQSFRNNKCPLMNDKFTMEISSCICLERDNTLCSTSPCSDFPMFIALWILCVVVVVVWEPDGFLDNQLISEDSRFIQTTHILYTHTQTGILSTTKAISACLAKP